MSEASPKVSKRERTPAQMEALERARIKAVEVRARNTELRRKEREVVNAQLQENRRIREEKIQQEYQERFAQKEVEEMEATEDSCDHSCEPKQKKKKKVVVVRQESSSSEEEVEIRMKNPKRKKYQDVDFDPENYQQLFQKLFEF